MFIFIKETNKSSATIVFQRPILYLPFLSLYYIYSAVHREITIDQTHTCKTCSNLSSISENGLILKHATKVRPQLNRRGLPPRCRRRSWRHLIPGPQDRSPWSFTKEGL